MGGMDEGTKIRKKSTQRMPVKLTEHELLEAGRALAQADVDVRAERENQDAVKAGFKETLQKIESRRGMLAGMISSEQEYRDIDCEDVFDYDAGRVTRYRLDTGEVIVERPMTNDERQRAIPLIAPGVAS